MDNWDVISNNLVKQPGLELDMKGNARGKGGHGFYGSAKTMLTVPRIKLSPRLPTSWIKPHLICPFFRDLVAQIGCMVDAK
jgi:hypothetical protein